MKIRPAKLSDYEELMKLFNLFVEEDRYSNHDNDSFKFLMEKDDFFIYVAEEKAKLIGLMTFSIRSVVRFPRPIVQLEELFVLEEFRKMGIGRKFIDIMEEEARKLNCCNSFIESRSDKITAHEVYQKLGYKKDGFYFKKVL